VTQPPAGLTRDAVARYWDIRDAHDSLAGQPGHEDIEPGQVLHNDVIALAAQQPFFAHSGGEVFPDEWEKAAAALRIITQRHPFMQGNKRTAWLYTVTLLGQFGRQMPDDVEFDYVRPLVVAVSEKRIDDVSMIASCLVDFFMGRYGAA
jgi:death on curing protein